MNLIRTLAVVTFIVGAMALNGCSRGEACHQAESGESTEQGACCPVTGETGVALPAGLFLSESPQEISGLASALRDASDGQAVTIRGRIGGQRDPFVNGRAAMMMVDPALPSCDSKDDDHCATPWDYCCEARDLLARHAVTVQVEGPDGKPLRTDLKGAGGLAPGKTVIVQGIVRQDGAGARTVQATGIYVTR